jgi:hypothetical protein
VQKEKEMKAERQGICQWAIFYAEEMGFSVIPIRQDKKSYIKWQEFQKRRATRDEIEGWWRKWPDAMIGIVTGKVSNLFVIDCDTTEGYRNILAYLPDPFDLPAAKTPRGGRHLYFTYKGLGSCTVGTNVLPGVDYRGEGGYVIAPPSVNIDGNAYAWFVDAKMDEINPPDMPDSLMHLFKDIYKDNASCEDQKSQSATDDHKMFQNGRRDNDLFHVANQLVKSGTPRNEIMQVIDILAKSCNPPFPEGEFAAKVESALKRAAQRDRCLAAEIRVWVTATGGHFSTTDVHTELQLATVQDKRNANEVLRRLCVDGVIERYGTKNGCYRKVDKDYEVMDFKNASTEEFEVRLPMDIHDLCKIYAGNVIVVAGTKSAGKTAFLLNVIKENMDQHEIVYMTSEMGESELKTRLILFGSPPLAKWKFKSIIRNSNWADLIDGTRKIWLIDYLETQSDKLHAIADEIRTIQGKLKEGICIIALQKPPGRDTGRGDTFSLEKARLYLALDFERIKIVDAKAWRNSKDNPRGKVMEFKLSKGSKFQPCGSWKYEKEREKKPTRK